MSLPQFLNYLRFLRWRRPSSKTKACKFLGIHSPLAAAVLQPADLLPLFSEVPST